MNLFFLTGTSEDGENLDLFVIAHNRAGAVKLWQEWEFVAELYENVPPPAQVFLVPTAPYGGFPRLLDWSTMIAKP